jgi:hypothetical protein
LIETIRWYNPVRRVEEKVPAPMSDAQAIEMLSGDEDSDRLIEVYRQLRNRHPEIVQALILTGATFHMKHRRGQPPN